MGRFVSTEDLERWSATVRPFPLPEHLVPTGGNALQNVDEDVLLVAPPSLIAHVQRTAAQGGLQVVSPRQTPFSSLMTRLPGGERLLGDHIVGVTGDPTAEWPTIDDADFSHLLPDEPLASTPADLAVRTKTKTEPITQAGRYLSDPILSCLVKGRAVIDILRRDDVAGDGDAMTTLLANAWNIDPQELDDLDAFTLGVQGPLLRHAIKADEVFPVLHAPNQVRRTVTVGASEVTRDLLPLDSGMDWRRMRVFCEAVFTLSCAIEGHPIKYMRSYAAPGDPTAPSDRPNVMAFMPAPCTAWTFESSTFSIYPTVQSGRVGRATIPKEVMEALARYTEVVRPVSYVQKLGYKATTKRTTVDEVELPLGETIGDGYRFLAKTLLTGSARGRTAAATVRNLIFNAVENAPFATRLKIARYLTIASEEAFVHLGLREVPDIVIDKIAIKFVAIGDLIRMKVAAEAARRGASAEAWWADIVAQAPERYKVLVEGTQGWARVGMWLVFRAPTENWVRLVKAVHYRAVREAEVGSIGGLRLPPEKGSKERLVEAARQTVKAISTAYAGYYVGVADVGMALADAALDMGRPRTADALREGAILWHLRSRCLRGSNVHPIAREEVTPSANHLRVFAEPVDLLLKPAPYKAFEAYKAHAIMSPLVSPTTKKLLQDFTGTKISDCFRQMDRPIAVAKETVVTRFLVHPQKLAAAMEQAWSELVEDVRAVSKKYGADEIEKPRPLLDPGGPPITMVALSADFSKLGKARRGYFDMVAQLDPDEVDWVEDLMDSIDPATAEGVYAGNYGNVEDLRATLQRVEAESMSVVSVDKETVR